MNIKAFFTGTGTPQTGLVPHIDIFKLDGTQVITTGTMTEIGGGFYYYDFSAYDNVEDYSYVADGTATLKANERYAYGGNEDIKNQLDSRKILKNKLTIASNVLTIFDDNGTTPTYLFDLKDEAGNPSSTSVFQRIPQ